MNFGQKGSSRKDGPQDTSNITGYHCGEKGHYANTCPKKKNENVQVHTNIEEGTDYVQIPKEFMTTQKCVTLTVDVMFVNNLAFVITFGRGIGLITMELTPMHMAKQLAYNLVNVIQLYSRAGFGVQTILMDMEFDKVIPELPGMVVNTSAAKEHVADIEQRIRVVKE